MDVNKYLIAVLCVIGGYGDGISGAELKDILSDNNRIVKYYTNNLNAYSSVSSVFLSEIILNKLEEVSEDDKLEISVLKKLSKLIYSINKNINIDYISGHNNYLVYYKELLRSSLPDKSHPIRGPSFVI
ncbi:MAG: hypothetical protein N4A49_03620 [Marinifilaceae bacterium]|jgi:hypothetical protein|nr:hypothetical protein [Marinifilaceae bacterium]